MTASSIDLSVNNSPHTSSQVFPKPSPLVHLVKEVWKRGVSFADRLKELAASFNQENYSKSKNTSGDAKNRPKDDNSQASNGPDQQTQNHQNQEPIMVSDIHSLRQRSKTQRDPSLWGLRNKREEVQTEVDFEEYIQKKIHMKKTIIEITPGKRGYVNVDEFLKKLKQKKQEKRARNELKISREQFKNFESLPSEIPKKSEPTHQAKSLFELLNPGKQEEKLKGPRELRMDLRDSILKKKLEKKSISIGEMNETGSSEDKQIDEDEAPKVGKSDNSTIFEDSEEDEFEKSTEIVQLTQDNERQIKTESQQKQEISQTLSTQEQKLIKVPSPLHLAQQNQSEVSHIAQHITQVQPKFNPFLSVPSTNTHPNDSSQSPFAPKPVQSVVEEMKNKLFGNNSIQQENSFVNGLPKSVSRFCSALQNTFTPNLSCAKPSFMTEAQKTLQINTPVFTTPAFSGLSFQPNLSVQPNFNQPAANPFMSCSRPQNFQQIPIPSNQLVPSFMKTSQPTPLPNQNLGFSAFNNNQTPSFLKPHVLIPTIPNPIFGNHSSSNIFPPPSNNQLAPKAFAHLIKPNLLNDQKNKQLLNSFMKPSNKNTFNSNQKNSEGLFSKLGDGINEDDWDKRTEKRAKNSNERGKRGKKEERVRQ